MYSVYMVATTDQRNNVYISVLSKRRPEPDLLRTGLRISVSLPRKQHSVLDIRAAIRQKC